MANLHSVHGGLVGVCWVPGVMRSRETAQLALQLVTGLPSTRPAVLYHHLYITYTCGRGNFVYQIYVYSIYVYTHIQNIYRYYIQQLRDKYKCSKIFNIKVSLLKLLLERGKKMSQFLKVKGGGKSAKSRSLMGMRAGSLYSISAQLCSVISTRPKEGHRGASRPQLHSVDEVPLPG